MGHSELVLQHARGNVGVRLRIHVGIYSKRNRGAPAFAPRESLDALELGFGLQIQAKDVLLESQLDLGLALADAREHGFAWISARGDHARKLAARYDVKSRSAPRE